MSSLFRSDYCNQITVTSAAAGQNGFGSTPVPQGNGNEEEEEEAQEPEEPVSPLNCCPFAALVLRKMTQWCIGS